MISLLVHCPKPNDPTSFYRGVDVIGDLKCRSRDLSISFINEITRATLRMVDAVFLQRPSTRQHLAMARLCRAARKPLWVDYDDDLTCVPADNPTHPVYSSPEVQKNLREIVSLADTVTVSTKRLGARVAELGAKRVRVVPNAFDDHLFHRDVTEGERPRVIVWRGSPTHQRDLAHFAEPILELAHAHKEWAWNFVGWNPWFLTEEMPKDRCFFTPGLPIEEYFGYVQKLAAPIQIVPLYDNEFNRSKSNIAWIEGTFAGSACIVPNWEEWQRPGAVTYDSREQFHTNLKALMEDEQAPIPEISQASWEHIEQNLLLSKVNETRREVLEELIGRKVETL